MRWGRGAALLAALLVVGCQAMRPDFAARSREDCEHGDLEACRMLSALNPAPPAAAAPARTPPRRVSPVEADVAAMLKGIERARAMPRGGERENVPAPQAPVHADPSVE